MNQNPTIFSIISCAGGAGYGYYLMETSEVYNNSTHLYPSNWELNDQTFALLDSIYSIGAFIGTLISGYLSYRYGRIFTLLLNDFLTILFILIFLFTQSFSVFAITRFVKGINGGSSYPLILIMIKEMIEPQTLMENHLIFFQTSNTLGIFLSNLISLSENLRFSIGFGILFPLIRFIYFALLYYKKIETPVFRFYHSVNNPLNNFELQKDNKNYENEDTIMKENFSLGNIFGPNYIGKIIFCLIILFLNQLSGINIILKSSNSLKNQIILSTFNFLGGLLILLPFPKRNMIYDFKKFVLSMIILIVILIFIAYIPILFDENYFPFIQCAFLLIFQYGVSYFPFIIITSLLPDIGIFVVLLLHWIFSMSISIIPIQSHDEFRILIRSFFLISLLFLLIGIIMYLKFIKSIMREIYQKYEP